MIRELDQIVLQKDIHAYGLKAGDIGTVVLIHKNGNGYEVEFVSLEGKTLATLSLAADKARTYRKREIAHVRSVEIPLAA